MARLRWIGWDRIQGTEEFLRFWEVEAGSRSLGVRKGDTLVDRGPTAGGRWEARRGRKRLRTLSDREAATLFPDGAVPLWDPPSRRDLELLEALREGNRRAAESERHLLNMSAVLMQLKDLYLLRQGALRPSKPRRRGKAVRRGLLRLVARRRYRGGEPYSLWELTADAPWIPLTFGASDGKPHAQAGDRLVEQPGDGEDPWILKRAGREVAYPEPWQMAQILEEPGPQREPVVLTFDAKSDQAAVERLLNEILRSTGAA